MTEETGGMMGQVSETYLEFGYSFGKLVHVRERTSSQEGLREGWE